MHRACPRRRFLEHAQAPIERTLDRDMAPATGPNCRASYRAAKWIDQELRRSSGRVKWKVVPTPTWLSAQIRPPCASTIHCEM
jgi:hypothetical protein